MIEAQEMDTTPMAGPWQLPKGWEWIPLRDIISLEYGKALPARGRKSEGSYPVFGSGGQVGTHTSAITSSPAIIVGRKGSIGATFFSEKPCWPIDTTYYVDQFASFVDPKYIYTFLKILPLGINKASAIPGLNRNDVYTLLAPIPFPNNHVQSLDIQHWITDRIEALLADLQEAQNTLESLRQDIDQTMDSVLSEVFEDSFGLTPEWIERTVEDLCHVPQYGYTQSAISEPIGPKFLRITDIQDNRVNWDTVPYCQISQDRLPAYLLQKGDILFARSGATTGKTFLIGDCPTAVFASYLIRLRIKEDILPELLAWFFKSRIYWAQIQLGGSAQPNMNAQLLKKVKVRYPRSREEQQQIINYLTSIQEHVDKLRAMQQEDKEILQQVEQSILNQAFISNDSQ